MCLWRDRLCKSPTIAKINAPDFPATPHAENSPYSAAMPVMDPPVAGEQPQLQPETVPAGGEQPQRQEPADFTSVIDGMTNAEDIGNVLFDRMPAESPPADAEPAGQASGETTSQADPEATADEPDGTMPQEPAAEDQDSPPAEPTQAPSLDRISLRSLHPDDRLLVAQAKDMVREGKAPRLADAIRILTQEVGTPEPSPQAQTTADDAPQPQAPAQAPAPVEIDSEVARLTSHLAELRSERTKAATEEYDRPRELELTGQIEDALAALAEAKSQAIYHTRETTLQEQAVNAVIEDIYVAYPDSEDPASFFSYRLTQEVATYEQAHGPIGRHPAQLRQLAAKVAQEIAPKQETKPQAQAAPAPRQNARPLGTSAPGSASSVRPSPDNIQRLLQSADEETMRSVLFGT